MTLLRGCENLPSIVRLLTSRLTQGFMAHVLGATLYTLLEASIPGADPADVEEVGPDRYSQPRHPPHYRPSFLVFNGIS
jgi:hypothetical protein